MRVALKFKVYRTSSHTVAAEGGAGGVIKDNDSLDNYFDGTVAVGSRDRLSRRTASLPKSGKDIVESEY